MSAKTVPIADKILHKLKRRTGLYLDEMVSAICTEASKATDNNIPVELWDGFRRELESQVLIRLGGCLLSTIGQLIDDSSNRATKKAFHHIRFHAVQMLGDDDGSKTGSLDNSGKDCKR